MKKHKDVDDEELDRLRELFAARFNSLIGTDPDDQNLEEFSEATGVAPRQISQWRSTRHVNWPSCRNLIAISRGYGVSIDWLLLGKENGKHKSRR